MINFSILPIGATVGAPHTAGGRCHHESFYEMISEQKLARQTTPNRRYVNVCCVHATSAMDVMLGQFAIFIKCKHD